MSIDRTPRYAPKSVMTVRGVLPVSRYIAHSPGSHPGSPIRNELTALEMKTEAGSRWFGCERAYIDGSLEMVIVGIDDRNQIMMQWKKVP